ncbi:DUF7446 family protein [Mycobacterium sp. MS1601]|uniref:DUF7446 family protein n=1 Tax=Mycobacterium sp. MS1601 TaxID=1936029 RepID=UPI0026B5C54F
MVRRFIHAPDGGSIPGALCQEPTGDVASSESDVDCPECLDRLEASPKSFDQLAQPLTDVWRPADERQTNVTGPGESEDSTTERQRPLGVVFSEQSRTIHVGPMNEAHDGLVDEMEDVTSTAVVAVADYVFAGTGAVEVNLDDGSAYRIEVVKVGSSRSGHRTALLPGSAIVELPDNEVR